MKSKGAIFDMDGVLFDTEKIFQKIWHELAEEYGVVLPDGFAREITGSSGPYMCRIIEKYYRVSDGMVVIEECRKRIRERLKKEVPKKPGVEELLSHFRSKGMKIAVASSSTKEQIESNLKIAGIRQYFDAVTSGKEVKYGKPAPDIFLLAAQRIDCAPEDCYVFEDSENGIRAGVAAGCRTIMIPDLIEPTEEIRDICYDVYENLENVAEVL
ncbi:HAD family hydrolase [Faecalicatena contorta]|uniref:HAD family hydrolase n=1 Tax=Faecalicatena contorta TaxID=39482 RepID=UPI001F441926|nr:HAD family phosphatase [Faecalicatena contorta]MCF2682810.1 HAD family phosphatase [Faecalicatena contorta]